MSMVKGTITGLVEAAICYPTEYIKTQLQLQSKTNPGMGVCLRVPAIIAGQGRARQGARSLLILLAMCIIRYRACVLIRRMRMYCGTCGLPDVCGAR
jgi:hypothetical protein